MFTKNKVVFFTALLFLGFFFFNFSNAEAADRYWVGGTGNWTDDDNHWSDSSGGAPADGNLPTATDNCIFDTNSIAVDGAYSVSISNGVNATCNDFTMDGPGSGFNVTFASTGFNSKTLTISGSMNLIGGSADITRTYTGSLIFNATSGTKTLTSNGVTFASGVTFDGVGGTWQLVDAFSTTGDITLTNGSFDTNGQTLTAGGIDASNSNTRSITLGASTLNLGTTCMYFFVATNLTFNAGTSTINCTGGQFRGSGKTFYNVIETTTSTSEIKFYGENTFNNLTITGSNAENAYLYFYNDQTINDTFTVNGNSAIYRVLVGSLDSSSFFGTPRTITAGAVSVSNADFQDIVGAGAGDWDLSSIVGRSGDCGNNSGIILSTPSTRYWVGGTGSWSDTAMWSTSSGGASGASVPLCSDNVVFDANSFDATSETATGDIPRLGADISFTGVLNNPTVSFAGNSMYGSLTLVSGMDLVDSEQLILRGRSMETLISGGNTPPIYLTIDAYSGTYTLADALSIDYELNFLSGTFDANDVNVTVSKFISYNSAIKTLNMGSGTWEITGIDNAWSISDPDSLSLNAGTSTIKFNNTSDSIRYFYGGGKTYNNFWSDAGTSAGNLYIDGSNTFNDFKDTGTVAHNILFTNGTTQTVSTFNVSGTLGNLITLNSDNDGDTFALVKTGGGTVSSDYLSIQHSIATPADTWYAGLNSTDNQVNATAGSGWIFTEPPVVVVVETPRSSSGSSRALRNRLLNIPIIPNPSAPTPCINGALYSSLTGKLCDVTIPPTKFQFLKNLSLGMINPDVKELQKYLNTHGFPVALSGAGSLGNETTKFGALTKQALIKFQQAKGITPVVGYFGPITRAFVNSN